MSNFKSYISDYDDIAIALAENAPEGVTIEKISADTQVENAILGNFRGNSFTYNVRERDNPPRPLVITRETWDDIQKYGDIAGAIIRILRG